jgi:hypothetical protein
VGWPVGLLLDAISVGKATKKRIQTKANKRSLETHMAALLQQCQHSKLKTGNENTTRRNVDPFVSEDRCSNN